ncbi:hypothetical protein BaRGS_00016656 [Batillaria attramentaria]|uniref:Uncharacterized protein n=1 Tax=Batillaria attramentaria TaxID=370345 RepID=A0ABD0KY80_9CAEN
MSAKLSPGRLYTFLAVIELRGEPGLIRQENQRPPSTLPPTTHDVYTSLVWLLCVVGEGVDELLVAVPKVVCPSTGL